LPLLSFLRVIGLTLTPLPPATKMAQLMFRDQKYVSSAIHFVYVYTPMSIHSMYLVCDLEDSDIGDPLNGIVYCLNCESRSSHGFGDP
jgi:hypothetical protein